MYTFILILDSEASANIALRSFIELGPHRIELQQRHVIEAETGMAGGWIAIAREQDLEKEYNVEELMAVNSQISDPLFFLVEGRDGAQKFSNNFIEYLSADLGNSLIDNDHGIIAPISVIKQLISMKFDWLTASKMPDVLSN